MRIRKIAAILIAQIIIILPVMGKVMEGCKTSELKPGAGGGVAMIVIHAYMKVNLEHRVIFLS